MHNPNWNKQANMTAGRSQADRGFRTDGPAAPVTEDELEAYRFQGTPIRRSVPPVARKPLPVSHDGNGSHGAPGSPNERMATTVPETLLAQSKT